MHSGMWPNAEYNVIYRDLVSVVENHGLNVAFLVLLRGDLIARQISSQSDCDIVFLGELLIE